METAKFARNWKGEREPMPVPAKGVLLSVAQNGRVALYSTSKGKFAVVYCLQMKEGLNYVQAAEEFGSAVMHDLASGGMINGNY